MSIAIKRHSREPRIESGAGAGFQKKRTGFWVKPGMTNRGQLTVHLKGEMTIRLKCPSVKNLKLPVNQRLRKLFR